MQSPSLSTKRYSNRAEDAFVRYASEQGWQVSKRGWPDFLVFDAEGRFLFCVEVKTTRLQRHALEPVQSENWRRRRHSYRKTLQRQVHEILEASGIDCKVWTPDEMFGENDTIH